MSEYDASSVAMIWFRPGVEVQQNVEDVEAVARGAGHHLRADPSDLVVDRIEPGQATFE